MCVPDQFKAAALAVVTVMQAVVVSTCVAVEALASLGACVAVVVGCGSVCVAAVPEAAVDAVAHFIKGAFMPVCVLAPLLFGVPLAVLAVSYGRSPPRSALVCSACFAMHVVCDAAMRHFVWGRWYVVGDWVCWTSAVGFIVSLAALGREAAGCSQASVAGFDARVGEWREVEVRFVAVSAVGRLLWHAAKVSVRVAWRGGAWAQRGVRYAWESLRDADGVWSRLSREWASSADVPVWCGSSEARGSDAAHERPGAPLGVPFADTVEEHLYRVRKQVRERDEQDAAVRSQLRHGREQHQQQRWQQHQQPQQTPRQQHWASSGERPEQPFQRRQQMRQQHRPPQAQAHPRPPSATGTAGSGFARRGRLACGRLGPRLDRGS